MLRFNHYYLFFIRCNSKISIHPMLRFNGIHGPFKVVRNGNFNTSYVTVQLSFAFGLYTLLQHFNTSYVTVQRECWCKQWRYSIISIHPMLRFNRRWRENGSTFHIISIHPMLRFNFFWGGDFYVYVRISIHPMLRFNGCDTPLFIRYQNQFQYILCYGSTIQGYGCFYNVKEFQYILCYGSTYRLAMSNQNMQNFNTSYVTVQLYLIWIFLARPSHFNTSYVTVQRQFGQLGINYFHLISIHPMLRFNVVLNCFRYYIIWFQYILCYGSTWFPPRRLNVQPYFNTSYVTVQR